MTGTTAPVLSRPLASCKVKTLKPKSCLHLPCLVSVSSPTPNMKSSRLDHLLGSMRLELFSCRHASRASFSHLLNLSIHSNSRGQRWLSGLRFGRSHQILTYRKIYRKVGVNFPKGPCSQVLFQSGIVSCAIPRSEVRLVRIWTGTLIWTGVKRSDRRLFGLRSLYFTLDILPQ